MKYETVIGLEVHAELKTKSKLFCGCSTAFGSRPNTQCCPVCLGLPGSLPVLNRRALELAVVAALALNCSISGRSRFDRKNYFYPDLPKAFQISQYACPLGEKGYLRLDRNGEKKRVGITRVHLEEEAGKLIHPGKSIRDAGYSLVDYNRAGIPLVEIVSEPEIDSPSRAHDYLEELRLILLYAGVSDCRMEEGSLRCDANISLRWPGDDRLGTKVEVKNMNSFRSVKLALEYEAKRQAEILAGGGAVVQETRHWDEGVRVTASLRGKEEASDYRYFPEPDLPPLHLQDSRVEEIGKTMPELPEARRRRFRQRYSLEEKDIEILLSDPDLGAFFDKAAALCGDYREAANWVNGEVLRITREEGIPAAVLDPSVLAETIKLLKDKVINRSVAREILPGALRKGEKPARIVERRGLGLITDRHVIEPLVEQVINGSTEAVESYLAGKEKALDFLVGKVMSLTRGRAEPSMANRVLLEKLNKIAGKGE